MYRLFAVVGIVLQLLVIQGCEYEKEPASEVEEIDFEALDISGELIRTHLVGSSADRTYLPVSMPTVTLSEVWLDDHEKEIRVQLQAGRFQIKEWEYGSAREMDRLSMVQWYAIHTLLREPTKLRELDLVIQTDQGQKIVSVALRAEREIRVTAVEDWNPKYSPVNRDLLVEAYMLSGFEDKEGVWQEQEIAIISESLKQLRPQELPLLHDVSFVRRGAHPDQVATTITTYGDKVVFSFFDEAFESGGTFVGSLENPFTMGHCHSVNLFAERLLQVSFAQTPPSENRLLGDFLTHRTSSGVPSVEESLNVQQAFLNAYVLYALDPHALHAIDVGLYQWFGSSEFVQVLP